ncbi:hypothetical protein OSH11_20845 [Kaistia dalseonensis]|uniref:Hemerythrin-like domain-containing protein n=1 Tax=Kaistia dalseonensis TaxID=410840 RepID=A0ABU0HBW2_9HYPH|nr:hypothetical protein [Kaistia dalseonensis]MCX5497163.1 hypothetical protein [Kaistia dalseonensis]MDQ0439791.1 hypothetical protein [Kaistia dalseonensis]
MTFHSTIYVNEERYNLYTTIHKGLRRAQMRLLERIGSIDAYNDDGLAALIADMRLLVTLGRKHLIHENEHIHGVIEERHLGATDGLVEDHEHHERDFDEIEQMLNTLEVAMAPRRSALLRALYLRYSQFIAEDFTHMVEEETETLSLLHQTFDDETLAAIEQRIVSSVDPEMMLHFLRIMIPAMNPSERVGMLGGMKAAMPAPIFAAVLDAGVKPVLEPSDWRWLEDALSIAA